MAARQWTAEQRAQQAQAIQRWRPWDKTKGPTTPEGKARSAMRGFKNNPRGQMKARRLIEALIEADLALLKATNGPSAR
ncbi:MAG: hypothetical protein IH606_23475 [Burkholderiales bacterium]|nr:hypothetical protein [Burkholderiales bacterium]